MAIGDPLHSDVLTATAGDPVINHMLLSGGQTVLGLASLGGQYVNLESTTAGVFEPVGTAGPSVTSTGSVDFSLESLALEGEDLKLGLLGSSFTGSGFDSLEFQVIENGTTIRDLLFTNLGAATNYFNDNVLDLGALTASSSGNLDLEFDLVLSTSKVGDGFDTNFLFAGPSVPEPSTLVMGLIAMATVLTFVSAGSSAKLGRLAGSSSPPARPARPVAGTGTLRPRPEGRR